MTLAKVAFLGPSGTHTEKALLAEVKPKQAVPCFSIAEVFEVVAAEEVAAGFVPLENLVEGPVTETLDLLREYRGRVYIETAVVMGIKHALGVLEGGGRRKSPSSEEVPEVKQVFSHWQALKQCSRYLRAKFPQAKLLAVSSTAEAAELVRERGKSGSTQGAAVLAGEAALIKNGFKVLESDISDVAENKTRFVLIKKGDLNSETLSGKLNAKKETSYVTSLLLDPKEDRPGLLLELLEIISLRAGVNMLSIHSRPEGKVWQGAQLGFAQPGEAERDVKGAFVFYVELEGHLSKARIKNCISELREFHQRISGELDVVGCYEREGLRARTSKSRRASSNQAKIGTLGIIGSQGEMGVWLSEHFAEAGVNVIGCDLKTKRSAKQLAAESDVLILSLPMAAVCEVCKEISPELRPGTLVIENSSIKKPILPELVSCVSEEVEVLGMHTLFGGSARRLAGENVVLIKTSKSGARAECFEEFLALQGAQVSHTDIARHDAIISLTISLAHLLGISLAHVIRESFDSEAELQAFSSPNFRAMFGALVRLVHHSPEMLAHIQTLNEFAPQHRNKFLQTLLQFTTSLNQDDTADFVESIKQGRDFFKES